MVERLVESVDDRLPFERSFGYVVELLFDVGCEVETHHVGEVRQQEVVDYHADVGRKELALFGAAGLGAVGLRDDAAIEFETMIDTRLALAILFDHVAALLDGLDGGRIGRRAADAEFFEPADERRL